MRPYLLIHCTDTARSSVWYQALGFQFRRQGRQHTWAELEWGGLLLFLHQSAAPRPEGFAMPGFEVTEPLEAVLKRLAPLTAGELPAILDEGFGRTATLHDPDGYAWSLNEHDPELYA
ncbi:VOC family protein [Deinococcus antarcticus]|uniref:VOC family protein n=1 Tax=Deinococcus antarcticus TaxID=1298767 RepID=A0ABV8A897_9DEIO